MWKFGNVGMVRVLSAVLCVVAACGSETDDGKDESCDPKVATSCTDGLVCEQIGAERFECLAPVIVSGRVFSALDSVGVAGATVVGIDANGAARTRVTRSGADGRYELPVSLKRKEDGSPVEEAITLRVAAADHQPFPVAPRTALPIQLATASAATVEGEPVRYRVQNAATDVSLLPLPLEQRGGATVSGKVSAPRVDGVLVLALVNGGARSSAVSDLDGSFVLFNVAPGAATLEGYRAGVALAPRAVDVPAAGLSDVVLTGAQAALSTVSGSLSIVNAAGGLATSVILVVASTFDATAVRGEAPAGLRASPVSGAFEIRDVPPGQYRVLAAFENDQLVRDPDLGISGTDVVSITVGDAGGPVTLSQGFKVTGALAVVAPGAQAIDEVVAGPVVLSWADDSSEDGYELRVYDAFGTLVHSNEQIPRVSGGAAVTYTLDATSFTKGMLYQFRVWSFRNRQVGKTYIAATEDLKGVFQIKL